jgi:hypothetical protein
MRTIRSCLTSLLALLACHSTASLASDLALPIAGRVTIEFVSANAGRFNSLWVSSASGPLQIGLTGCALTPNPLLSGAQVVSSNVSTPRCRVELDASVVTPGIQGFAAGTVLRFQICSQSGVQPNCTLVWSSNPQQNSDGQDHVRTSQTGNEFLLAWEDQQNLGDHDFNDLKVIVRVTPDSDGDGIWDDWEVSGIPLDGSGRVFLPPGANPNHKDVWVWLDYMDCNVPGSDCPAGDTHTHKPLQQAIDAVVAAFSAAPVSNPDGVSGINLHVVVAPNPIAHQRHVNIPDLCFPAVPGADNFDTIKARSFPSGDPRRTVFHYGLITHQQAPNSTMSGCAETPGNDFQISLGGWNLDSLVGDIDGDGVDDIGVGTIAQQAGTLMHELGHNLGLHHGGDDDVNGKPNYLSVMSYSFQMDGVPTNDFIDSPFLSGRFDYSRQALAFLDEFNLQELPGLGAGNDNTIYYCPNDFAPTLGPGTGFIDWNCNGLVDCRRNPVTGTTVCTPILSDVNLDGVCVVAASSLVTRPAFDDVALFNVAIKAGANRTCDTVAAAPDVQVKFPGQSEPSVLRGVADWPALRYDFQSSANAQDGVHVSEGDPSEITYEEYQRRVGADLIVTQTASQPQVTAGTAVALQVGLTNRGLPPARNVVMKYVLIGPATLLSCVASDGGTCSVDGNTATAQFPVLKGFAAASITLSAVTGCAADGALVTGTATATTTTPERSLLNNTAVATVTVANPPPAIGPVTATPSILWPPNGKLVDVTLDYAVTNTCGTIACALDVASNPAPPAPHNDGDNDADDQAKPYWIVIDDHHVQLRAKRAKHRLDRIYTITAACTNSTGASVTGSTAVTVPYKPKK